MKLKINKIYKAKMFNALFHDESLIGLYDTIDSKGHYTKNSVWIAGVSPYSEGEKIEDSKHYRLKILKITNTVVTVEVLDNCSNPLFIRYIDL